MEKQTHRSAKPQDRPAFLAQAAEASPLKPLPPETDADLLRSIRSDERAIATYEAGIAQKRKQLGGGLLLTT